MTFQFHSTPERYDDHTGTGRHLIPDLYVRTRDVKEYWPPYDPVRDGAALEAIVGHCIAVWMTDGPSGDV